MNDRERLKQQIGELGLMFLKRTQGEIPVARALLERARGGDHAAVGELEHLAHRVYGTGATLGFDGVSEQAGLLERLAEAARMTAGMDQTTIQRLEDCLAGLEAALRCA